LSGILCPSFFPEVLSPEADPRGKISEILEAHHGDLEAHPAPVEAHTGPMEAHPGAMVKYLFEAIRNFVWKLREITRNLELKSVRNYSKFRELKTTFV
jgi:hypothetical protein